jgi:GTP-binding protein YchF
METIDPVRDLENILLEITFSDLEILERRLIRINNNLKGANSTERDSLNAQHEVLDSLKKRLEQGIALRDQSISDSDLRDISSFGFLSIKPLIIVLNIGEESFQSPDDPLSVIENSLVKSHVNGVVMCAQLEMEFTQMSSEEEIAFRDNYGVNESGLDKMVRASYEVLDQISFFTVGEDEVRAWQVRRNTAAQKSAGKIHSDLEKGFIRAEVISCEDLLDSGGLINARRLGLVRQEGKEYIVKDGDIMHVLFNL